jgi:hypothetical protein
LTVVAGQGNLSPIGARAQTPPFKEIQINWESTATHFEILALCNADAHGQTFDITVSSYDYDLSLLSVGNGTETGSGSTDRFKADANYPNDQLTTALKALSGDAAAAIPSGIKPGQDFGNTGVSTDPGSVTNIEGLIKRTVIGDDQPILFRLFKADGSSVDQSTFKFIKRGWIDFSAGSVGDWSVANIIGSPGNDGYIQGSSNSPKLTTWAHWALRVDNRDTAFTHVVWKINYERNSDSHMIEETWEAIVDTAQTPNKFAFSGWANEVKEVRLFKGQ